MKTCSSVGARPFTVFTPTLPCRRLDPLTADVLAIDWRNFALHSYFRCTRLVALLCDFRCTHPFLKEIWRAIDKPQSCDELQFKLESLGNKEKFCLVWNMFYRNAADEQTIINTQEVTTPKKSTVYPPPPSRHLQEFATSLIGSIFDILEWWETGES